jgi:multidrug transporter EmrE-like cation transporter
MSDRLSAGQVAILIAYAAAMAGGQLLFKAAAMRGAGATSLMDRIAGSLLNGYFVVALVLYAALTVLWVWVLSFTPLARAYPFVALAFALTPALGVLVFGETASLRLALGIALIVSGLCLIAA